MIAPIRHVVVYTGHQKPPYGPYGDNIAKRIEMFHILNRTREEPWEVHSVSGEELVDYLKRKAISETLLVIPAGQSSHFDAVFTAAEIHYLQEEFFKKGGRGYFTCGAAYWVTAARIYKHPGVPEEQTVPSIMPLFQGRAVGPLCPFPGLKYRVGFYSDAVEVMTGDRGCTVFLSGGGSFFPDPGSGQRVRILTRYRGEELTRLKKEREFETAALLASVGAGAILLQMFHPYYGSADIDPACYEAAFPDCGTNWREVHARLSSEEERMNLARYNLTQLENMDFN